MFNNLYNFSKNAWHVKLFKWIYNVDPTQQFKSMCPYFWTYMITLLFLPLVLIIKLFGKSGTLFLNYLKDYRKNKEDKAIERFKLRVGDGKLFTNQQAYKLSQSNCYKNYYYYLDYDVRELISDKSYDYRVARSKEAGEIKIVKDQEYKEFRESITYKIIGYIMAIVVTLAVIYGLYQGVVLLSSITINWEPLLISLAIIACLCIGIFLLICLSKYVIIPIANYLSCIKLPKCYLCKLGIWRFIGNIFKIIGLGICLIGDMIYNTYKKNCPLITWKEDK